jgi:hypothetical protein
MTRHSSKQSYALLASKRFMIAVCMLRNVTVHVFVYSLIPSLYKTLKQEGADFSPEDVVSSSIVSAASHHSIRIV